MLYESEVSNLVNKWIDRSAEYSFSDNYRTALQECAYELNHLIEKSFQDEVEAHDYFAQQEADAYLSTIEAHEQPS